MSTTISAYILLLLSLLITRTYIYTVIPARVFPTPALTPALPTVFGYVHITNNAYINPGINPNNVNNIQIKNDCEQPLCNNTPNGGNTIASINSNIPLQSQINAV